MKKFFWLLPFVLVPAVAFGADVIPVVMEPVTNDEFLNFFLASLGGFKGASVLVASGVIVQLIIRFLKTPMVDSLFLRIGGEWKLTIVTGLSVIAGVIGLMSSGVTFGAALFHSATLSAFSVFLNQIYRQATGREPVKLAPRDPPSPPSPLSVAKPRRQI